MKITEFSVKNWQFTIVIFVMVAVLGLNSLFNMPRGEDPPFHGPMFFVVAVYPGTSPADMEELVTDPIEDEMYELDDIKRVRTEIGDGLTVMRVEFQYGVDVDNKYNDVVRELNRIRPDLPQGIVSMEILRAQSSDVVVQQSAIVSETASYSELEQQAEDLKQRLERIRDFKKVEAHAYPEQRVEISLNLEKMSQANVSLNRVLQSIQGANVNIPGGSVDVSGKAFNIQTLSDLSSLDEIRQIVVNASAEGRVTYLRDIADIRLGYEDESYRARFNGKRAVWVTACLKDEKNIIKADAQMQPILAEFEAKLPKTMTLETSFNQAAGVARRLDGFTRDFSIAILLVLITLVPLGWRASVVVMISIPLSLSIGLTLLDLAGFTINQLSIVGMVVALGLLVDDSIVVVENIERFLRMGYSRRDAAISSVKQIAIAVVGCTATLVLAFLPLAFLPEGSGDFIRSLPMSILLTVLASLFVALTIVPFLSSLILKPHEVNSNGNFFLRAFHKYVNKPYEKVLLWAFRHPAATLIGTLVILIGSIALVPKIGFSLFPQSEKPMFLVNIETPLGSNLDEVDNVARYAEAVLLTQQPKVVSVSANVGKGNPRVYYNLTQKAQTPNYAQLLVQLDPDMHVPDINAFCDEMRAKFAGYPGAKIEVKQFEQGPPVEAPIEMRLFGENLDTLRRVAADVERIMAQTEGTRYINNPLSQQKTDLQVVINRDKAGMLGIPMAEVAKTVRMAIAGLNAGEFRTSEGKEYTMNVSVAQNKQQALEVFQKTYISSVTGALIPLSHIATLQLQTSPSAIRHYNKERFASVTAFPATGYNTAVLTGEVIKKLDAYPFPKGYSYIAAGERESSQESFGGMGTIIIIAVFCLLAILVLEFRSFKSTLIVLSVIPLGTIGALITLFLVGKTLSFVATIGLIGLVGIEIKNSILLVDYTNQLREQGRSVAEAILEGAETRFLPILLTTCTAIGGLIPLVLEDSPLYSPLAWVLIGGLISSTLLSRLVTPLLYKLLPPPVTVKTESEAA